MLAGLGQHVDGAVVRVFPAAQITGRVVTDDRRTPCPEARVGLRDNERWRYLVADGDADGAVRFDVTCRAYPPRPGDAPIVVTDKNIAGLEWVVDAGAASAGQPIVGAVVYASSEAARARGASSEAPLDRRRNLRPSWARGRALPDHRDRSRRRVSHHRLRRGRRRTSGRGQGPRPRRCRRYRRHRRRPRRQAGARSDPRHGTGDEQRREILRRRCLPLHRPPPGRLSRGRDRAGAAGAYDACTRRARDGQAERDRERSPRRRCEARLDPRPSRSATPSSRPRPTASTRD